MYFKCDETVYSTDDLEEFVRDVYDYDEFDEYLDGEYEDIEILDCSFTASEVIKAMDEYSYERGYSEKVSERAEGYADALDGAEIGDTVDIGGRTVIVCDEDGNTENVKTETVSLAYSSYKVEGGEDKVLVFETEGDVEIDADGTTEKKKYKVEIPLSVFKEVARQILF